MSHPLVDQLHFTRREWLRALDSVSEDDGSKRLLPMNSIGWIVGHLAWQEQRYWLTMCQGQTPLPELNKVVGYGRPASTPSLTEMQSAWQAITQASDPFLAALTTAKLRSPLPSPAGPPPPSARSCCASSTIIGIISARSWRSASSWAIPTCPTSWARWTRKRHFERRRVRGAWCVYVLRSACTSST